MESRERSCLDCGELKPYSAFTPIRGTSKVYGRCKICRARRARGEKAETLGPHSASGRMRARVLGRSEAISPARTKPTRRRGPPYEQLVVATERTCTECGKTKPLSGFLRILWKGDDGVHRHGTA
jgi:hypothetical protein